MRSFRPDSSSPMFFRLIFGVGVFGLSLLAACSGSLSAPTQADATAAGVAFDTLVAGRKLYVTKCAGCHNLYPPDAFKRKEWPAIVKRMEEPAKITSGEGATILKYLNAKARP